MHTARLTLRPFIWSDLAEAHRLLYADPEVAPAWAGRTKTLTEIKPGFARKVAQPEGDFGFLAIERKDDQHLVGTIALQRYCPTDDTSYISLELMPDYRVGSNPNRIEVELTYALGRAYWGHGYASEAGRAVSAYGFNELGVWRIVNDVSSQNTASIKVMQRLGFNLQRNLHPKPFGNSPASGVIGILDRASA